MYIHIHTYIQIWQIMDAHDTVLRMRVHPHLQFIVAVFLDLIKNSEFIFL